MKQLCPGEVCIKLEPRRFEVNQRVSESVDLFLCSLLLLRRDRRKCDEQIDQQAAGVMWIAIPFVCLQLKTKRPLGHKKYDSHHLYLLEFVPSGFQSQSWVETLSFFLPEDRIQPGQRFVSTVFQNFGTNQSDNSKWWPARFVRKVWVSNRFVNRTWFQDHVVRRTSVLDFLWRGPCCRKKKIAETVLHIPDTFCRHWRACGFVV